MAASTIMATVRVRRYRIPLKLCALTLKLLPGRYAAPICQVLMRVPRVGIRIDGAKKWQWQPLPIVVRWQSMPEME